MSEPHLELRLALTPSSMRMLAAILGGRTGLPDDLDRLVLRLHALNMVISGASDEQLEPYAVDGFEASLTGLHQ